MRVNTKEMWPYWDSRLSNAFIVSCDDQPMSSVINADTESGRIAWQPRDDAGKFIPSPLGHGKMMVAYHFGRVVISLKPEATPEQRELFAQMKAEQKTLNEKEEE